MMAWAVLELKNGSKAFASAASLINLSTASSPLPVAPNSSSLFMPSALILEEFIPRAREFAVTLMTQKMRRLLFHPTEPVTRSLELADINLTMDTLAMLTMVMSDLTYLGFNNAVTALSMVQVSIEALLRHDISERERAKLQCKIERLHDSVQALRQRNRSYYISTWNRLRSYLLSYDSCEGNIDREIDFLEKAVQSLVLGLSRQENNVRLPSIYGAITVLASQDPTSCLPAGYNIDRESFEIYEKPAVNDCRADGLDVTMMIKDIEGKDFWKQYIGCGISDVEYDVFISAWRRSGARDMNDEEAVLLKDILDTAESQPALVTSFSFSLFLSMFGPFSMCRQRVLVCTSAPWFFGALSATQTLLAFQDQGNHKAGTFLVRYSQSDPGRLVVTYLDTDMKIKNDKIYNLGPLGYSFSNTLYSSRYETVAALIRSQR